MPDIPDEDLPPDVAAAADAAVDGPPPDTAPAPAPESHGATPVVESHRFYRQDNEMDRFERAGLHRFTARQALVATLIGVIILVLAGGESLRKQGEEMHTGIGRFATLAAGKPAAALADLLPIQTAAREMTGFIHPSPSVGTAGSFTSASASASGIPVVTPAAFDPSMIGAKPPPKRRLRTMLVTGDSMSSPLDQMLAQTLAPHGVKVIQDPHDGTAISSTFIVNWGALATYQVKHYHPQAVVMFIGANDGFSMTGPNHKTVNCCSAQWAAIYAQRVRQVMNTFRQNGVARVYWLTLPAYRGAEREHIAKVVNAAFSVAAQPWASQVRIVNTIPVLTPGDKYRDSLDINGQPTVIRQSDGVHLNNAGSELAAKLVLSYVRKDFTW